MATSVCRASVVRISGQTRTTLWTSCLSGNKTRSLLRGIVFAEEGSRSGQGTVSSPLLSRARAFQCDPVHLRLTQEELLSPRMCHRLSSICQLFVNQGGDSEHSGKSWATAGPSKSVDNLLFCSQNEASAVAHVPSRARSLLDGRNANFRRITGIESNKFDDCSQDIPPRPRQYRAFHIVEKRGLQQGALSCRLEVAPRVSPRGPRRRTNRNVIQEARATRRDAGVTTLTRVLLLLLMAITRCTRGFVGIQSQFPKVLKGVRLPGGYMEMVEEKHCSYDTVRLTCRSLEAFMFIVQADYLANQTHTCGYEEQRLMEKNVLWNRGSVGFRNQELRGNYDYEVDEEGLGVVDVRQSVNRRCSGQKHCRYSFITEQPGAAYWRPATLRITYACIPETSVRKYCNEKLRVVPGEGGFVNSPGFPLYYLGETTCGWTFRSAPGQRIVLTFHDLDIRGPEVDGSCVDVVRVRERGRTLLEHCGTAAGVRVVSDLNVITLDLVASKRFYTGRGFFLQYQVLGCPDVSAPNGSYILNSSLTSRTFLCKLGTVFPDSKERTRILECRNGKWNESVIAIPSCIAFQDSLGNSHRIKIGSLNPRIAKEISCLVKLKKSTDLPLDALISPGPVTFTITGKQITRPKDTYLAQSTSAVILKTEHDHHRLSSLSGDNILGAGVRIGRGEDAVAVGTREIMDSSQSAMMKQTDYVVDVVLPTVLIALLFVGNAIIVYIIFQYRKRKVPSLEQGEEMALRNPAEMPQV
ncbi:CUB and sushi domain-containing protein 1 [Dufourea novaeangliae]|uniref:CUB and sushi domain-containing protein 1 n=1 Tax=Dufourea novaeangliae TaxID=178035 RepID=A0A154PM52_DUFNO|nr:CUB and sushi domain-containing protein 1 [Dufourea novaeangliae]